MTLHSFSGETDGCEPVAPLAVGPGGVLYGTTFNGGVAGSCFDEGLGGCGTVFQLTPPATSGGTWTYAVIYSFTGINGDGSLPGGGALAVGKDGVLYGTTQCGGTGAPAGWPCSDGGVPGSGTVFALLPPTTGGGT